MDVAETTFLSGAYTPTNKQAALKTQVLRRFALVVKDASGVAIERHVLDMQVCCARHAPSVHQAPIHLPPQLAINTDTVVWSDVVSAMRGMLTKHSLTSNTLPSLPNNGVWLGTDMLAYYPHIHLCYQQTGCTFEIAAYTLREGQSSASVSPQLWVEELPGASGKPDVELPSPFEAVFVKSVHLPGMAGVQVYLEVPPGHAL